LVEFLGINKIYVKKYSKHQSHEFNDFIEKYSESKNQFCLYFFELLVTVIILVEQNESSNPSRFANRNESYQSAMIVLFFYGVITAAHTWNVFAIAKHVKNKTARIWISVILFVIRAQLMFAASIMMFTTAGHEARYGFWILTNLVHFCCHCIYTLIQITFKFMRKHGKNKLQNFNPDQTEQVNVFEITNLKDEEVKN
jgi:hypothetical protein